MKNKVTIRKQDPAVGAARRSIRKSSAKGTRKTSNCIPGRDASAEAHNASTNSYFRYAVVSRLSAYKCCSCSTPIRRRGIRRVVICPVCNTANELKK